MNYNIDFQKSIWELMPPHKRQNKRFEMLQLFLAGLVSLHEDFLVYIDQMLERVNLSCETIALEYLLNKTFDPNFNTNWPATKPIYITNQSFSSTAQYSFTEGEQLDELYSTLMSENNSAYAVEDYSFLSSEFVAASDARVNIALSLNLTAQDIIKLRGLLARYIFLGKKYIITYY